MAGSLNKAMLIGRLGRDPEIRYTTDGLAIANLAIATSENYKDKDGNVQSKTEWHRVVCFGRLAEICGEYLTKGRLVYVEGKLQTRSWTDEKSGEKKYTTEIVANSLQMLEGKGNGNGAANEPAPEAGGGGQTPPDDDIPF